ncbi:MAG TPA: DinB family protein [Chryseosolibacter sp.]|nr:DinB family protein [Chryseosolibacter sp.]
MGYSVLDHLRYNAWANSQIADLLTPVSEHVLYERRNSSFPSIAATLLHIWDAEVIWLKRMQGSSPSEFQSAQFSGDKTALLAGFTNSSRDLLLFIESKDPAFLLQRYSYRSRKGEPFSDTVEETLFHIVNHGSYHRGQITTLLRQANVTTLVSTDLIQYLRSR